MLTISLHSNTDAEIGPMSTLQEHDHQCGLVVVDASEVERHDFDDVNQSKSFNLYANPCRL